MKKLVALPLAVLFAAACSESTAPNTSANLTPSYAKPVSGPDTSAICTGSGCLVNDTYTFQSAITAASSGGSPSVLATELKPGTTGTEDAPAVITKNGQSFIGRFENVNTEATLSVGAFSSYSLYFDLYTIGSWDGKGKQAQNGIFQANVFSVDYICSDNTRGTIFSSTFSNQLTVQQDYPNALNLGGFKAATGSYGTDLLDYRHDPTSNTPVFRSFGDVEYRLYFTGTNPCVSGGVKFAFSTSNPAQQSVYDESWGLDNIVIRTK